jgi:hypothetical protein
MKKPNNKTESKNKELDMEKLKDEQVANKKITDNVIELSTQEAGRLWADIKQRLVDDPTFVEKTDDEKVELYQKSSFKDFYTNFPIVCKYMLCMGQYSKKAFRRYLIKCKSKHLMKDAGTKSVEDEWVHRQADYIRYLWEAYQHNHINRYDSDQIWQHAYKTLTDEFADFKKLHSDVEKKLKSEKTFNKTTLVKELLQRIVANEQTLDTKSTNGLIIKLEDQINNQRKKYLLEQIKKDVEYIAPSRVKRGACVELPKTFSDPTAKKYQN